MKSASNLTSREQLALALAAKAAYERFVKEAGFEHDARIREWNKLSYVHQVRWVAIARAVIESFRGEDKLSSESRVSNDNVKPRGLRSRVGGNAAPKQANRNRGARRR